VVPYIVGEEDKLETEAQNILGALNEHLTGFEYQRMKISAACNRVAALDGHMACVSLRFAKSATTKCGTSQASHEGICFRGIDTWVSLGSECDRGHGGIR